MLRKCLVLWPLLASACAPTLTLRFTATNAVPHALTARLPDQVEVHTVQPPDRSFVDVGVFEADDANPPGHAPVVIQLLRTKAGQTGCDSIVVQGPFFVDVAFVPFNRYRATCIVYR